MLTLKCSNFILQGPVQFISPIINWPLQIQKIYAHRKWGILICIFAISLNTVLWQVLWHCLVHYVFLFSPTFVYSITQYLLQWLLGSIPLLDKWIHSKIFHCCVFLCSMSHSQRGIQTPANISCFSNPTKIESRLVTSDAPLTLENHLLFGYQNACPLYIAKKKNQQSARPLRGRTYLPKIHTIRG